MSHKIQITIADEIYELLEREAKEKRVRILTYAAILFSEYLIDRAKKKKFDDGFG